MKMLLAVLVLASLLQGCSTVKGIGHLMAGIGDDTIGLSDAIKTEIGKDK